MVNYLSQSTRRDPRYHTCRSVPRRWRQWRRADAPAS